MKVNFEAHPKKKGPIAILSKLLKEHEKIGLTMPIIEIPRKDKKQTLIDLKIFFVSIGGKSKDARKFFKENYKLI